MPDVNGLEVLRYVRSQPALHALPVIMMSAHENAGTGACGGSTSPPLRDSPLGGAQFSSASSAARRTTC